MIYLKLHPTRHQPLKFVNHVHRLFHNFSWFRSTMLSVIMSSKAKSCQLDPVPTWILKGCIDALLPTITTIINSSLEQGRFPSKLKESVVRPSIKKPISDSEDNNNFRPISNLTFLSKTLERLVASQLDAYLTDHQLYANMQSAYRKHHSTETALLLGAARSISSL